MTPQTQSTLWYDQPIFFEATPVDMLVLLTIFPVALDGVGIAPGDGIGLRAFSFGVGAVGGFGSKIAHDYAHRLMQATLGRLISLIGGSK